MLNIKKIDHLVITTPNFDTCLNFYHTIGFKVENYGTHASLFAGDFKINVHNKGAELFPHATHVQTGSADFCLEVAEPLTDVYAKLISLNIQPETEIVSRFGVNGAMNSLYLRDPDGNLLEFSEYLNNTNK